MAVKKSLRDAKDGIMGAIIQREASNRQVCVFVEIAAAAARPSAKNPSHTRQPMSRQPSMNDHDDDVALASQLRQCASLIEEEGNNKRNDPLLMETMQKLFYYCCGDRHHQLQETAATVTENQTQPTTRMEEQAQANLSEEPIINQEGTPTTAPPSPASPKNEWIIELCKLAHGAGVNTHGMELEELERAIAKLARQHEAAQAQSQFASTTSPPPPPRSPINPKKQWISELRKLAHGAGINTHGMELDELEQVIAHLAAQHETLSHRTPPFDLPRDYYNDANTGQTS